jgi:hypothetical protein
MSLILTQLMQDIFPYTNRSPLTTPWSLDTFGDPGLQVQATIEECVGTATGPCAQFFIYTGGVTPNDQFIQVSVQSISATSYVEMMVRVTDTGVTFSSLPGYRFFINGNGTWAIADAATGTLTSGSGVTVNPNDVFTLAAIGSTIYALHNSTVIGSVTDTSYGGGFALVATDAQGSISNLIINSVVFGSAAAGSISGNAGVGGATIAYSGQQSGSVTCDGSGNYSINVENGSYTLTPSKTGYSFSPTSANETFSGTNITGVNFTATQTSDPYNSSIPFLGSVRVLGSAPSNQRTPYIGTIKVLAAAPAGLPNNYVGDVVVGTPSASDDNPVIGQVVIVASLPAGNSAVFLGAVEEG